MMPIAADRFTRKLADRLAAVAMTRFGMTLYGRKKECGGQGGIQDIGLWCSHFWTRLLCSLNFLGKSWVGTTSRRSWAKSGCACIDVVSKVLGKAIGAYKEASAVNFLVLCSKGVRLCLASGRTPNIGGVNGQAVLGRASP